MSPSKLLLILAVFLPSRVFGQQQVYGQTNISSQITSIFTATASATIPGTASNVLANCTTACTLTLPAATAGWVVTVKNVGAVAGVVTIIPPSGTIDLGTNMFATNGNYVASGQAATYRSDGTSWFTSQPIGPGQTYPAYLVVANQTANYTLPNNPGIDSSDFIALNQTTANIQFTLPSPTDNLATRRILVALEQNTAGITLSCPGVTTPLPLQYGIPVECIWTWQQGAWTRILPRSTNVQVFNASGTYIPSQGVREAIVEIWSGGGANGSCPATTATTSCITTGGEGGGYAKVSYTWAQLAAISSSAIPVTVGAGGTAGAAGANAGGTGGTSTFGNGTSTGINCIGGTGGGAGATNAFATSNTSANNFSLNAVCTVYTGATVENVTGQAASSVGYSAGTTPFFLTSQGGSPPSGGTAHLGVGSNAGGTYVSSSATSGSCIYLGSGFGWGSGGMFSGTSAIVLGDIACPCF